MACLHTKMGMWPKPLFHRLQSHDEQRASMITIEQVARTLRGAIGIEPGVALTPYALAAALGLVLIPGTGERACLFGTELHYDDTASRDQQLYQIARGACAYALRQMNMLRDVSPHALAMALCNVASAPSVARVRELRSARQKRQANWLRGA